MFLIAGLGNPGREYDGTRHNMGFDVIDELIDAHRIPQGGVARRAMYGKGRIGAEPVILIKPITYMNNSGEAVRAFVDYYKLDPEQDLLVICDDIDQAPGNLRIRRGGSDGGQKGLRSIISHLGTKEFARVRIGVGAKPAGWDLADYVLSRFGQDERKLVDAAIREAAEAVEMIVAGDIDGAMNRFNARKQVSAS